MPPEYRELAGQQPIDSNQGLGIGLYLTEAIVTRLSGNMSLATRDEGGTIVTITLPLKPYLVDA